jgi:hypothetical protein
VVQIQKHWRPEYISAGISNVIHEIYERRKYLNQNKPEDISFVEYKNKTNSVVLSPPTNYTD